MVFLKNLKELSFLIYGLGITGNSVLNFFKKNNIKNYKVWDDKNKYLYKSKRPNNLDDELANVDHIVLSPGVSLQNSKNRKKLIKYRNKIITDLDLAFLFKSFYKSIVVTGTNGKSTTCKIINHLLNKNKFNSLIGGNIGTPVLSLKSSKKNFLVIEASSFQLAYSKFLKPDYAMILNITNDHLDWHGTIKNYINSKFKIFTNQNQNQYSFINKKLKLNFHKRNLKSKLLIPEAQKYKKIKFKIKNSYLSLNINDENMSFVYSLSRVLKINVKNFINALNSFQGLPHRYEIFLKKKNCIFINDSKATSFQATKYALQSTKNIYWIVGGLPKKNDKINVRDLKKNIIKSYIIGNHINFFKKDLQSQIKICVTKNLKNSIKEILKDIKSYKKKQNIILFSPAAASFDQFLNFERRGEEFKRLTKIYAGKSI